MLTLQAADTLGDDTAVSSKQLSSIAEAYPKVLNDMAHRIYMRVAHYARRIAREGRRQPKPNERRLHQAIAKIECVLKWQAFPLTLLAESVLAPCMGICSVRARIIKEECASYRICTTREDHIPVSVQAWPTG